MIDVNKFKPGISFQDGKEIFVVIEAQHSKQGRGQASVKAKIKNLRSGATIMKTWTGGDKVKKAHIDKRDMDYLYNDGTSAILMDRETFEQVEVSLDKIKWELNFMIEGRKVMVRAFESEILDIELPANVELKVTEAPEAVKGNTANNPQKFIKVETGFEFEAPMFIKEGQIVIVSTENGKYVGRSN
ncbi:elongation factor P [Mycoplasma marinum]|uniref:Elongation factor P n=1 Tax=Mycoplasma marinum TaxID=1937190 RepID=A0A4R0XJE0_9MOLU|nr:elongation factor P [Mycoplasma marinum]TCG10733.1 elongation factor P [Mycoplasma marinum]